MSERYPSGTRGFRASSYAPNSTGFWSTPVPSDNPQGYKSLSTAYLLLVLLGSFGAHKYYLRQPGWGTFYLVTSIPAWILFGIFILIFGAGALFLVPHFIALLIDAIFLPDRVRMVNYEIQQGKKMSPQA